MRTLYPKYEGSCMVYIPKWYQNQKYFQTPTLVVTYKILCRHCNYVYHLSWAGLHLQDNWIPNQVCTGEGLLQGDPLLLLSLNFSHFYLFWGCCGGVMAFTRCSFYRLVDNNIQNHRVLYRSSCRCDDPSLTHQYNYKIGVCGLTNWL